MGKKPNLNASWLLNKTVRYKVELLNSEFTQIHGLSATHQWYIIRDVIRDKQGKLIQVYCESHNIKYRRWIDPEHLEFVNHRTKDNLNNVVHKN